LSVIGDDNVCTLISGSLRCSRTGNPCATTTDCQPFVDATQNSIQNSYLAAFAVRKFSSSRGGPAYLRGEGNKLGRSGFFAASDCQRGTLIDRDNAQAHVDFGMGDSQGTAIPGLTLSAGGNKFCAQAPESLIDVWDQTDTNSTTCGPNSTQAGSI